MTSVLCACEHPLVAHYNGHMNARTAKYMCCHMCSCRNYHTRDTVRTRGVPVNNLPAVSTCREMGWGAGTVLASDKWKRPRTVKQITGRKVWLLDVELFRVESLPVDVRPAK